MTRCLLFALLLSPYALAQAPATRIQTHGRQAQEYLRTGHPDLAAKELQAIVALDPDNVEALSSLGVARFFAAQYNEALQPLRRTLELRPALPAIEALLGMTEKRTGAAVQAVAHLEHAFPLVKDEKVRVQAGLELIELYFASNALEKAAGVVAVLRQLRPTDVEILYTARRIFSQQADEALLSLSLAAPQSARMHQAMAQEMARQGDTPGSIRHYREAARLDPKLPGIHFELAERLADSASEQDTAQVEPEYLAALKENPFDLRSECRLAELALKRSDIDGATARYRRALSLQPEDAEAVFGLAKTLLAAGKSEEALPKLEQAARLDPFNATVHYRLGGVYRELGRLDDTKRELAEYQRLRELKDKLRQIYTDMRVAPSRSERGEEPAAK